MNIPYERKVRVEVPVERVSCPIPRLHVTIASVYFHFCWIFSANGPVSSIERIFVHLKDFEVLIPYEKGVASESPSSGYQKLFRKGHQNLFRNPSHFLPEPEIRHPKP